MTEGMPASKCITVENSRLIFFGQNLAMNIAVKKPKVPPNTTDPQVAASVPTIILNTP